ncbi:hypothetical protein JVU11DRAFT_10206 [Chiua virens]|nr:hypothetical protein JVU11DRAFT_10206 [Chiua virens]
MRLIFSNSYYKNTDISDEQGNKLYTITTPRGWKQVTTITKWRKGKGKRSSRAPEPEILCIIEWHRVKKTRFWFGMRVVDADTILYRRPYSWGRYFRGPDGRTYKWKLGYRYCWLKNDKRHGRSHLVKFHRQNLGIRKPFHPPYLEVAEEVSHMLDHIVLTYIYVERIRRDVEDEKHNLYLY